MIKNKEKNVTLFEKEKRAFSNENPKSQKCVTQSKFHKSTFNGVTLMTLNYW